MSDYEKIINNLTNQYDYIHMRNQYPNRVILGVEIVRMLEAYNKSYYFEYKYDGNFLFMGLPVTVDYRDRWIMMVCAGNESDGQYVLRQ